MCNCSDLCPLGLFSENRELPCSPYPILALWEVSTMFRLETGSKEAWIGLPLNLSLLQTGEISISLSAGEMSHFAKAGLWQKPRCPGLFRLPSSAAYKPLVSCKWWLSSLSSARCWVSGFPSLPTPPLSGAVCSTALLVDVGTWEKCRKGERCVNCFSYCPLRGQCRNLNCPCKHSSLAVPFHQYWGCVFSNGMELTREGCSALRICSYTSISRKAIKRCEKHPFVRVNS